MARYVEENTAILDIATGTGDVIASLIKHKSIKMAVGIDMAQNMLLKAQYKIADSKKSTHNIFFIRSDAMKLPFCDESFDIVTMAFGIRNMPDPVLTLNEAYRVLKIGGKVIILEFSLPTNTILQKIYFWKLIIKKR